MIEGIMIMLITMVIMVLMEIEREDGSKDDIDGHKTKTVVSKEKVVGVLGGDGHCMRMQMMNQ
jgi:hypothetical protein